ncbi:hypothetical protein [Belnapia moabensis]|uniref:hypothetical protein n=1 Tax=Belnapia moabensis TaxID=365533 RepID=UPI0012EE57D3|nr:hypothetical protein [Belnapia moabensis]
MQHADRSSLTLAETISRIAWCTHIPRSIFDLAFRKGDQPSSEVTSPRATLQSAARGAVYGSEGFEAQLAAAENKLFGKLSAGQLVRRGKADIQDKV